MPYEAPTMPGSVATFATCCSAWSSGSSAREANTTPGTCIDPSRSTRNR